MYVLCGYIQNFGSVTNNFWVTECLYRVNFKSLQYNFIYIILIDQFHTSPKECSGF